MLLHVEVQGKNEKGFAERMFRYYYRILDRYDRDVAAIAILTGPDGKNIPDKYERRTLWGGTSYEYKTLCITDYTDEALSASDNPFAVVMLVAKEALMKLKGSEEEIDALLMEHKLMIVSLLQKKGIFGERKINAIMAFLMNYVRFKKRETNRTFRKRVDQKTGKKKYYGYYRAISGNKSRGSKKGREGRVRQAVPR